jgi:hypothetical protein
MNVIGARIIEYGRASGRSVRSSLRRAGEPDLMQAWASGHVRKKRLKVWVACVEPRTRSRPRQRPPVDCETARVMAVRSEGRVIWMIGIDGSDLEVPTACDQILEEQNERILRLVPVKQIALAIRGFRCIEEKVVAIDDGFTVFWIVAVNSSHLVPPVKLVKKSSRSF